MTCRRSCRTWGTIRVGAFFSILVVSWQAGDRLLSTLKSVVMQSEGDWRVIVKDAGSTDGSVEQARKLITDARIRYIVSQDGGIYDGMNQAVDAAFPAEEICEDGQQDGVVLFLNCGDLLEDADVLKRVRTGIEKARAQGKRGIYYGDIRDARTGQLVTANPRMDAFSCYRNVPCHQACFYDASLLMKERFSTAYRVRADYEHFLRCHLGKDVPAVYLSSVICCYEGGGFSESREGAAISAKEHREIARRYFSAGQRFLYRLYLIVTLQPLRKALAGGRLTSGVYNRLRSLLQGRKREVS